MFKLMNKKGFTLVELMIVVVILGILVAVAVPIFASVTKNAKIKACQSNMRVLVGIAVQIGTDNDSNFDSILTSGTIGVGGEVNLTTCTTLSNDFLSRIKGGKVPECPDDGEYTLKRTSENGVEVTCSIADHNPAASN